MPPPSAEREAIEPPPEVIPEAVKGFAFGAARFGVFSALLHFIMSMPHPMTFHETKPEPKNNPNTPAYTGGETSAAELTKRVPNSNPSPNPNTPAYTHGSTPGPGQIAGRTASAAGSAASSAAKGTARRSPLLYRPIEGFSAWISPASKVYRGLTPQFKTFIQIGIMSLGGYMWAEHNVNELRTQRRRERKQKEREQRYALLSGQE